MRLIYSCLFLLASLSLSAQFGTSGTYLNAQADGWESTTTQDGEPAIALPGSGWQASIDYWFRLPNLRIEFLPTLAYSQQESELRNLPATATTQGLHFYFNTNFYLFDLQGDCDCPTWSKEGPTLEKGLYFQISPGVSYFNFNMDEVSTEASTSALAFSIGGGVGFDIGLSDLITITPLAQLRYYPNVQWEGLTQTGLPELAELAEESSLINYHLGIRVGVRLDQ